MALNTMFCTTVVFNSGITDTVAHYSTPILMDYLDDSVVIAVSTLDQAVTLGTQYSDDGGTTWVNIGTTYSLPAGGSLVTNEYDQQLTGIKVFSGMIRFVATAATAPTTGNLKLTFQGMGD
jgi:hypothetical protein